MTNDVATAAAAIADTFIPRAHLEGSVHYAKEIRNDSFQFNHPRSDDSRNRFAANARNE